MKKALFILSFFIGCLNIHAAYPYSNATIVLYRAPTSSVIMTAYNLTYTIIDAQAEQLIGTGNQNLYLGNLTMVIHSSTTNLPHTLQLECTTYDSTENAFTAINGTAKLKIGIYKNFDLTGATTPFELINPTSDTTTLRSDNNKIQESHILYFFVEQDSLNSFYGGTYTGRFTLFFYTP